MDHLVTFDLGARAIVLAAICGLMLGGSGFAQSARPDDVNTVLSQLDNGKVIGNVYENKLLGLKIPFPKNMAPDSKTDMEPYMKEAIEKFKQGSLEDQKLVNEMIRKERLVFSLDLPVSEDSLGGTLTLTIKRDETGEELRPMIERAIRFFAESQNQKLVENLNEATIGVVKTFTFLVSQDIEGSTVYSRNYSGRRNGYLFTLSASYADNKGKSEMEAVIKGIEAK